MTHNENLHGWSVLYYKLVLLIQQTISSYIWLKQWNVDIGLKMNYNCTQVFLLQTKVEALELKQANASNAVKGPLAWLLRFLATAARAASASTGTLAILYCMTLPGIRTSVYNALSAESGTLRVPVLAVIWLVAFSAAYVDRVVGSWVTTGALVI